MTCKAHYWPSNGSYFCIHCGADIIIYKEDKR